ncbi:MAG: 50S ribosomal protein LX [Thermoprotei archaeon]|nr:MAG: 50S ribosomal protein LX [Thermoprotei archaeon]RLF19209.1 MAG: 50S ribosomal protein LX [Thermoprotei archaeon]
MSEVKIFRIRGKMLIGDSWQKFSLEVRALRKEHALEKVYSNLGSRHKLKRAHIKIEKIEEISPEEVTKPELIQLLRLIS